MPEFNPAFVLLVGALVVALVPRRFGAVTTVAVAALALLVTVGLPLGATATYDFYGIELTTMRFDGLARPFALVFAAIMLLGAVFGWSTMGTLERAAGLATAGAAIGVVLAGDLLTLFFFWELKVTTVVLLVLARRRAVSSAAATRYLPVHLVGGVVLLGGVMWQGVSTGSLEFDGLELTGPTSLVLTGFLVSAAAVPLHAWLPDTYPTATVAATVLLSAFTTKSAVYALARGFPGLELLIWIGVVMALVGVVFAILEDDIRRLLSYHIVSQVGFMVAAIGVGTAAAVNGATAHATAHVLYKGLLLMGAGAVVYATGRSRTSQLGGLRRALPVVLVFYMVGALSISGLAGFSGFPAKELAVSSIGAGGESVAQWLLKLASVGTFLSVALKLPALTWFGPARGPVSVRRIPSTMYVAMGVAANANVAIGLRPTLLFDLLPAPESFVPYTAGKLVESTVLLGVTAIAFVVLRARLTPKANTSLDTDVVYRELPVWLGPRLRPRVGAAVASLPRPAFPTVPAVWRRGALPGLGGTVAPGWVLGGTIAGAMVFVLALTVVVG
ncbi:MAG TPA: proton-conducting transporter membrane subunit [Ilumatobacteraceae bacterium]|nr:proton-conducting transporter membrane subunit [Ilumatobacteraceae bacterium]